MGMGYSANYADVIEEKFLEETCPKEYKQFMNELDKQEVPLEIFAMDNSNTESQVLLNKWEKLQTSFRNKTGLEVSIEYHDQENGDRYDDISGVFFAVSGMYQLTKAGRKMKDKVQRKFYVTFG